MSDIPSYVIIGATGGIGTELCHQLAARGPCRLLLAARDEARLGQLASELQTDHGKNPPNVMCHALDARNSSEVNDAFAAATGEFGQLTGAVNLCGSILLKPAHLTSDEEFADTVSINLTTAFHVLRAAAKTMTNGGSVVLMSTVATRIGLANHEPIAAAKAGINGLVISAAATYANKGLRVNAVAPGLVDTPLSAKLTSNELTLKASMAMHPLGRIGKPADIAGAITWLLDPANTWTTGQIISVDGGLSTVRAK